MKVTEYNLDPPNKEGWTKVPDDVPTSMYLPPNNCWKRTEIPSLETYGGLDWLVGKIVVWLNYRGSYGMGGPGFGALDFKPSKDSEPGETMIVNVWGSHTHFSTNNIEMGEAKIGDERFAGTIASTNIRGRILRIDLEGGGYIEFENRHDFTAITPSMLLVGLSDSAFWC